jgi:hypothetical protein
MNYQKKFFVWKILVSETQKFAKFAVFVTVLLLNKTKIVYYRHYRSHMCLMAYKVICTTPI